MLLGMRAPVMCLPRRCALPVHAPWRRPAPLGARSQARSRVRASIALISSDCSIFLLMPTTLYLQIL